MSEEKTVDYGEYVVTDHGNGLSTITVPEDPEPPRGDTEPSGFFARLLRWFKKSPIKPYVKIRDMADPTGDRRRNPDDMDVGGDGRPAGEIGIKISF